MCKEGRREEGREGRKEGGRERREREKKHSSERESNIVMRERESNINKKIFLSFFLFFVFVV
jgi:hypothetical protein